MPYSDVKEAIAELKALEETVTAYDLALGYIYLDATTVSPKETSETRGRTMAVLSKASYDILTAPKNKELVDFLMAHEDELGEQEKRETELTKRSFERISRIPADEYVDYNILINDAQSVWEKAKKANDFGMFLPYLEKIVETNRRFAGYYDPTKKPYDALLNEYERGLTTETLDEFFSTLRECIIPLIEKISKAKKIDDSFLYKDYPVEKQRILSDRIMEIMGLDRDHCTIAETEHPYTTNFTNKDVRITTHYHSDNLISSLYSVVHEGGHALYELGCDDSFNFTFAAGGVSMGIHESQSRFYENIIGRSREFIGAIYPIIKDIFPEQFENVSPEDLFKAANKAQPSLIRTEADELTYSMHIMVRYEIEKRLLDGSLEVKDIPKEWNRLYKEYLGIDVPDDASGCLQDSHWSGGSIGYFPSYALGSAYGAQYLSVMEKELPNMWEEIASGDLSGVNSWLRTHIHRYASMLEPTELFERTCGKFDPKYYTDYLTKKFSSLYEL